MKKIELELFDRKRTAVQEAKSLGVALDKQLTFNAHINENTKKGRLNVLVCSNSWAAQGGGVNQKY